MAEMAGNGLKWLEMAGNDLHCWKCLKITRNGWIGWKWLEMAGLTGSGLKLLEMA